MMFQARRSSTRGRCTAALALTPLLLALALLAGPQPAAAQQLWPDVNVYHSPNDDGVDPRSETCPPGCLCDGGGPSTPVTIDFDDDWDPGTVITDQYPEATFAADDADLVVRNDAGSYGTSEPNWIIPVCSDECSWDVSVDFTSPVENLRFRAATPNSSFLEINVDVYEEGEVEPTATVHYSGDYYAEDATVDLTAFSNVTRTYIANLYGAVAYDDFTFNTVGGELDCVIDGGTNERINLWINGGLGSGDGDICKLPPDGDTGDYLCGADILIEITRGTGEFTAFRPRIDTLVHHPVCQEPPGDDGFCPLPPETKRIRMNFRRGDGSPPIGPREVADLIVNSTGSTVGAPTTLVVSGSEAASANLQKRPIAAGGPEVIAEGPVGPQGPCVLQCDFDGNGGVGLADFNILAGSWGTTGPSCTPPGPNPGLPGDCDCNGGVGSLDFSQLSAEWGKSCPQ
jgi:hypothetical protein